jgi:hypothetical protein
MEALFLRFSLNDVGELFVCCSYYCGVLVIDKINREFHTRTAGHIEALVCSVVGVSLTGCAAKN